MKTQNTKLLPIGAMLLGFSIPNTASAQSTTTLPTVEVKADAERESGSYQAQSTTIGKLKQLPKDVPQALTIINSSFMHDAGSDTLKDALRNIAGLTFNAGEGGRIGDNMNLRGFYSFGDMYQDGIRDVAQYNRETFNLEQIDVLRGSGSMLFGRGQAGGVINQVSKEPMLIDKNTISATVGSNDYKRATADVNKVVGENMALRVNAMKTDAGSTRDQVTSEREGFAPTLRWGIGTKNEFSIGHFYLKTHNTPDYGIPFFDTQPLNVPTSRFYGTTRDYEDNTTNMTTGSYKHRFSNDTELKTILRVANYTRDLWAVQPQLRSTYNAGTGACSGTPTSVNDNSLICRSVKSRGGEEDTITSQTDFTSKFATGSMKHEALIGLELLKEKAARWSYAANTLSAPPTTVGSPDASAPGISGSYGHRDKSNINSYDGNSIGVYAQDSIEFIPNWKLLLGFRQDTLKARYVSPTAVDNLDFSEMSYRSGLMWQPSDTQSYYLAWNDSFNPTADLYQLDNGRAFPAERSQTTELGAKWELFDGNLSLRAAIYRAEKQWERNTDVESSGGILSKRRRTDGFELEAGGRITQRIEVFGGIALMNPKITEPGYNINAATGAITPHNPNLQGMTPRNAPKHTGNLWATYRFDGGWRAGLGAEAKGKRLAYGIGTGNAAITPNVAPAYVRWDAMVTYEQARYALKLNVLNLFNKPYYDSLYENGGHTVPGTQRAAQLTAEFKF
ncbi:MAG TPA: TonB-dependent siderophore receptor [Rhodocyclaceae bacterium]|nr:TonB-dependent siderophore receptor [Rhodocyclaceae bacterium]